jgi:hypothetical protein
MSRLRTFVYSCKCCADIVYPRRISKNEAKEQIEAELEYTPAEINLLIKQDFYDDYAIEEEYQNKISYVPDYLKNPCGVCGKEDDPSCKYGC